MNDNTSPAQDKYSSKATLKIGASFITAVLLIALVLVTTFWAFKQIETAAEARNYTDNIIEQANLLMSALKDAETGQRGYSLTGNKVFLEPYLAANDNIAGYLKELNSLTLTGTAQKHQEALPALVEAKLAALSHVIELRRQNDMTTMLEIINGGHGKQLMDSIRTEIGSLIKIEEGTLAQREVDFQANMRHLFAIIVTASLFTLLFTLWFALLIYREAQHRLKALVHLETQNSLEIQEAMNSQLQLANATLQASEEQLAVTLFSIGDAVIATDAEARITLLNPLAEQLTGWTLAQATGLKIADVFHIINKETRQLAAIPVTETLVHGTIQGLANHTVLISRDKTEYDISDSCAPIRDRNDQVIGAVLVFRNVTEEYAAQQALLDSTTVIQAILNTVVDGIITLNAASGLIETVNPAAEQMFGYSAGELIGQNFSVLITNFDQDQYKNISSSMDYYSTSDECNSGGLGLEVVENRCDGCSYSKIAPSPWD